jgi:hypothetical protein
LAFHLGHEADHSPPSSAKVKEWMELYLHSPIRLHGVVLSRGEHRGMTLGAKECQTTLCNTVTV